MEPVPNNIYQRLSAVMSEVAFVAKGDKQVNGQYTFASHDQVTGAVRGLMVKHGIVYHPVDLDVIVEGNRTQATFSVRFVNIDNPEDYTDVPTVGFGVDPGDKGPGKALSYGVKYALLKTLGLETGDDPDNDAHTVHVPETPKTFVQRDPAEKPKWSKQTPDK